MRQTASSSNPSTSSSVSLSCTTPSSTCLGKSRTHRALNVNNHIRRKRCFYIANVKTQVKKLHLSKSSIFLIKGEICTNCNGNYQQIVKKSQFQHFWKYCYSSSYWQFNEKINTTVISVTVNMKPSLVSFDWTGDRT